MCGIAGFYGFQDDKLIRQFSANISHRGPDGEGFYIDERVSLLSRRLAIIDRKGGDQPIYNEDNTKVIVYNGEIYNYLGLKEQLLKLGHKFKTNSDTEVILHGFESWGNKCFDKLNGMFAVAIYDLKKQKLTLARDHFGIKPLYYASKLQVTSYKLQRNENNSIIFSSEIKPILYSGLVNIAVNERILYRYLRYRIHDDSSETFFDGIHKLMPGEVLEIENSKIVASKFSDLESELKTSEEVKINPQDAKVRFRDLLISSIKMRLMSEVPVGTCLSGGLDSSTVVAVASSLLMKKDEESKSLGNQQNTFSAVFPNFTNDEEKYIEDLLNRENNIKSHKIKPTSEEFFKDLKDFVKTQEEPVISTGPYAQYQVMREAHKRVTVLLDGQGADEMMAGYLPYYFVNLRELSKDGKYIELLQELFFSKDILFKFLIQKIKIKLKLNNVTDPAELMTKDYSNKYSVERFRPTQDDLKSRLAEDIFRNSLQSLLRYEDRNSMRFSLEGRVPFLDFRLLRFLFSLPTSMIISGGWNKRILRESMADFLPSSIKNRRNKIGFTTPENKWFLKSKKEIYEILLSESFANRAYWDANLVIKQYRLFLQGKNDDTMLLWRFINTELWLREFVDVDANPETHSAKSEVEAQIPNNGKKKEIDVDDKKYSRLLIKTDVFKKWDNYAEKISSIVTQQIHTSSFIIHKSHWYVIVSEKIVAISQGRSFFIWDIEPTWWANTLSNFVQKTPYGIGLGSPWTMQIAIEEVGLPRILVASAMAFLTKPLGIKGVFYHIAGRQTASIDGPTEYSLYPSNVSAKLGPKDPQGAAEKIRNEIDLRFKIYEEKNSSSSYKLQATGFSGVVIIDANDIGRNVLGNATDKPDSFFEKVMQDNPMGQGKEGTPIVIVF